MLAVAPHPLHHSESSASSLRPSALSSASASRSIPTSFSHHQQRRPQPPARHHSAESSQLSQHPPASGSRSRRLTPQLAAVSEPPPDNPVRNDEVESIRSAKSEKRSSSMDIHAMPSPDLLKLLASLLQQIASANDALASPVSSHPSSPTRSSPSAHPPIWQTLTSAARTAFSTPTAPLSFHARNIPTISLEAYLLRILKYCPISNEVFLALLVYFDRMSQLSLETTGTVFAIDSYNVHRLVIAGITVASKFLSDVFYTNTRYAKVGGLPQAELNQLELQFLLLNDFRLLIRRDEMQKYAEQLMVYASNHELYVPQPLNPGDLEYTPGTQAETEFHSAAARETLSHDEEADVAEGGETTDDEPTIRATHSTASSETQSIMTVGSEDTDAEDTESTAGVFAPS